MSLHFPLLLCHTLYPSVENHLQENWLSLKSFLEGTLFKLLSIFVDFSF